MLFIGDTVRAFDGKIGEVSSQCFLFPEDGVEGCLVTMPGTGSIAYNTADLDIVTAESVYAELQAVPSYIEQQARSWAAELNIEIAKEV
jgi:hypothetical protein